MHNCIEPPRLIQHFLAHPPEGFPAFQVGGVPAFSTNFNLLTTVEPAGRRKLERLPLYAYWSRLLQPRTCFVGSTVSEYVLLPVEQAMPTHHYSTKEEEESVEMHQQRFLSEVIQQTRNYPFVIIKDIPTAPVLVGNAAHSASQTLIRALQGAGFVMVEGQMLAYVPIDFADIAEFLGRMSKARRKDMTRKLKGRPELRIESIHTGDARFLNEATLQHYYALYLQVYAQSEIHFDKLTQPFFRTVLQDGDLHGMVFNYYADNVLIGYNLCFVHDGKLLDKYVGFQYPQAREYNLYMVSWFHNLEYALEQGLTHYVAGWTDPEIKQHLGASFTATQHAVYVKNPLIRNLLKPFKRFFEADSTWHQQQIR